MVFSDLHPPRVSMLVVGHPQFDTQDDLGIGHGIPPIPEWQLLEPTGPGHDACDIDSMHIDYPVRNVLIRLRSVFQRARHMPFPTTRLHDLTCFVVHRLLLSSPDTTTTANSPQPCSSSPLTECVRYATVLYMFITQGPTYYSHAVIFDTMLTRFAHHFTHLEATVTPRGCDAIDVWLVAVGMVAATGTDRYRLFTDKARHVTASLRLGTWDDALVRIRSVLWLETMHGETIFRPHWDAILSDGDDQRFTAL